MVCTEFLKKKKKRKKILSLKMNDCRKCCLVYRSAHFTKQCKRSSCFNSRSKTKQKQKSLSAIIWFLSTVLFAPSLIFLYKLFHSFLQLENSNLLSSTYTTLEYNIRFYNSLHAVYNSSTKLLHNNFSFETSKNIPTLVFRIFFG